MKYFVSVCLAVVASCSSYASAAHAQGAARWAYTAPGFTGVFYAQPGNPGFWTERVSTGATYYFIMTEQGPVYTELYDSSRNLTVRLYAGSCTIRHANTGGQFILLYYGNWVGFGNVPALCPERVVITSDPE